jgi:hypothetical protein
LIYYASATYVQPLTLIERERLLPNPGEVTVRRGMDVSAVQVVARTPQTLEYSVVPASEILGLSPADLEAALLVAVGDNIREGMPLARRKALLNHGKLVRSPVNGTLIDIERGRLIVQKHTIELELRAMMSSQVAAVFADQGVLLRTTGARIQGIWDSAKEGSGKLKVVTIGPDIVMADEAISSDMRGLILVTGKMNKPALLTRAESRGVRGIITGSMPASMMHAAREISIPVLVTDGIGNAQMAPPIFELLAQLEEREATLFSSTTGSPGSRPEVVVPLPSSEAPASDVDYNHPVTPGHRVRILRAPYAGSVGTVERVFNIGRQTSIGARVSGADVRLSSGNTVFVPHANLDLIV